MNSKVKHIPCDDESQSEIYSKFQNDKYKILIIVLFTASPKIGNWQIYTMQSEMYIELID